MAARITSSVLLVLFSACSLSRDGLGQALVAEVPAATATDAGPTFTSDPGDDADAQDDDSDGAGAPTRRDGAVPKPVVSRCALTGLHAARIEADLTWKPDYSWSSSTSWAPAVVAGQGKASLFVLADVKDGTATLRACGIRFPAVTAVTGVTVSGTFADATWDHVQTTWSAKVKVGCDQPGCAISSELVQSELGLDLPAGRAWPEASQALAAAELRDDDGDGRPGVRFVLDAPLPLLAPSGYAYWPAAVEVTDLMLAMRLSTQLQGQLDGCGTASGVALEMQLQARVLACTLDGGSACLDDQAALLQRSLPVWTVGTASWKLRRLPAGSACADVRAAFP